MANLSAVSLEKSGKYGFLVNCTVKTDVVNVTTWSDICGILVVIVTPFCHRYHYQVVTFTSQFLQCELLVFARLYSISVKASVLPCIL